MSLENRDKTQRRKPDISNADDGSSRIGILGRYHHSRYYANPVEKGHGGPAPAPAHPFVRPAFDVRKDEAYQIMKNILKDELLK